MRRGMTNYLEFRIVGMDLSTCTNLTLMIRQRDKFWEYTGTYNSSDTELMQVTVPKADAVQMDDIPTKFQVALTDSNGIPRSHNPVTFCMGDLLKEAGYGS